jgi:hypothetical protein
MGSVNENLLTKGFSGKVGNEIVFRQVKTRTGELRTQVSKRPRKRELLSPKEVAQQAVFKQAATYAKTKLLYPDIKADYAARAKQAGLKSAYVAAITDFLKAPSITLIDTDYYKGVVGDVIWVIVLDDFKIQKATVTLQRADGTVIESGDAVLDAGKWKYVITQVNAAVPGTKVIATVIDRPGKQAMLEKVL